MHEKPPGNPDINPPQFVVNVVTQGLAFGEGDISGKADQEVVDKVVELVHDSPNILVPVDTLDDGCSDGRGTVFIYSKHGVLDHNPNRAKVFGGAVAMTAASFIGLGEARHKTVQQVFADAVTTLEADHIDFGAHTGEGAKGSNCGCGAIDGAPGAVEKAVEYENRIREVITVLGVDPVGVDEVFENYHAYNDSMNSKSLYAGELVVTQIISKGKIVKRLGGDHRERRIVLNKVRDYTVNQNLIRVETDGQAQVFGVDIWRLEDIASKLYPDDPKKQHKAFLSELIYTLAVAAQLTKGDLPVDMIEASAEPVEA